MRPSAEKDRRPDAPSERLPLAPRKCQGPLDAVQKPQYMASEEVFASKLHIEPKKLRFMAGLTFLSLAVSWGDRATCPEGLSHVV